MFCLLVRYTTLCFAYWSGTERFVLLIGPVHNVFALFICPVHDALFCLLVRYRTLCFAYWSGTQRVVLLIGPVQNALCFKSGTLRFVLLIYIYGPVQNALFLLHGHVPKFEPASSQAGNHRLPLQGTPSFQRLELFVPNFETTRYHCKELPVPRDWNFWFPILEP